MQITRRNPLLLCSLSLYRLANATNKLYKGGPHLELCPRALFTDHFGFIDDNAFFVGSNAYSTSTLKSLLQVQKTQDHFEIKILDNHLEAICVEGGIEQVRLVIFNEYLAPVMMRFNGVMFLGNSDGVFHFLQPKKINYYGKTEQDRTKLK